MTIRKGQDWGHIGPVPEGLVVVTDDAELFALLNGPNPPPEVGLAGGDLARTVGASGDRARLDEGASAVVLPVDVGVAVHDGGTHRFSAHAVARRSWWIGPVVGVLNAQFVGVWDVAPRSHPNDGWLDVVEVDPSMGVRQRWSARRRLPTGAHVPHPAIRTQRVRDAEWTFRQPVRLWLDDVGFAATTHLRVRVEPDALTVYV